MIQGKTVLAIIPARGGSKGLPRKNILPLLGKPLIAWTIEQALASKYLDKVMVSTDDEEIARIAKDHGAEVPFIRPAELATDTAKTIDVIYHSLEFYKERSVSFNYLALLEPTSPLRAEGDIDKSIKLLSDQEAEADSLVSVGEVHMEHPSIVKKIENNYVKPYEKTREIITRRQDLSKAYFPYGVIYLSKITSLEATNTFYQERTIPFFIQRWQNYEVDDIFDLMCIEAILKYKIREGKL
jgi:CMP-N,N'-diacetyllegionaminic acid synthase